MEIGFLLDRAKELLKSDKRLIPVLFVETIKGIFVIGLSVNFNEIDKKKMMMNIGRKCAKKNQKLKSLSFVSEANISKVNIDKKSGNILMEKYEAIVVAKLDIINNKKEIMMQGYEISNDNVIWKDDDQLRPDIQEVFLLDAFVQGYRENYEFN